MPFPWCWWMLLGDTPNNWPYVKLVCFTSLKSAFLEIAPNDFQNPWQLDWYSGIGFHGTSPYSINSSEIEWIPMFCPSDSCNTERCADSTCSEVGKGTGLIVVLNIQEETFGDSTSRRSTKIWFILACLKNPVKQYCTYVLYVYI